MTADYPWRPARVRVGTIGKAHGLDGSFRVADPCGWWDFPKGSSVLVNGEPRIVARCRGDELAPLIQLEGAGDRTSCELLRGAALQPRDARRVRRAPAQLGGRALGRRERPRALHRDHSSMTVAVVHLPAPSTMFEEIS